MADSEALSALPSGYRQLCVIAAALDGVGSRWALLILRDLARTPLRFSDLQAINPSISPTLLSTRLRELQDSGLVEQRDLRGPGRSKVYALTDHTAPSVLRVLEAMADLGATLLEHDPPADGDGLDIQAALEAQMELNGTFVMARRSSLRGYFLLDLTGWNNYVTIEDSYASSAEPTDGRQLDATATFFPPTVLMRIMGRTMSVAEAEAEGLLVIEGDRTAMLELLELLSFAPIDS